MTANKRDTKLEVQVFWKQGIIEPGGVVCKAN